MAITSAGTCLPDQLLPTMMILPLPIGIGIGFVATAVLQVHGMAQLVDAVFSMALFYMVFLKNNQVPYEFKGLPVGRVKRFLQRSLKNPNKL